MCLGVLDEGLGEYRGMWTTFSSLIVYKHFSWPHKQSTWHAEGVHRSKVYRYGSVE